MTVVVHWCGASVASLTPWDPVFARWLDAAQRARTARFAFERDRLRYRRAHGLLRGLLGRAKGLDAASVALVAPPGAKTAMTPPSGWRFNLSHAGHRVLVAWAHGVEVGADVEKVRPGIAAEGIGKRFFAAHEAAFRYATATDDAADAAFISVWTRKEALVKAWGDGLAANLRGFSVAAAQPMAVIAAPPELRRGETHVVLHDLDTTGSYCAARAGDEP